MQWQQFLQQRQEVIHTPDGDAVQTFFFIEAHRRLC